MPGSYQNSNVWVFIWLYKTEVWKKKNHKCCYMDTDSSIVQVITKDIYVDIAKNVEIWFYNSI